MAEKQDISRRDLLGLFGRGAGVLALGGVFGALMAGQGRRAFAAGTTWQIDPQKCTQCGKCATNCVLSVSAVRCFHRFAICGYCDVCTGYLEPHFRNTGTAAEDQMCPTGAILRNNIEGDYFQYRIDREACIGCARCVKGCVAYGNGSLHLQIDQDKCSRCNECSIAAACPAQAISRVDDKHLYKEPRLKGASADE